MEAAWKEPHFHSRSCLIWGSASSQSTLYVCVLLAELSWSFISMQLLTQVYMRMYDMLLIYPDKASIIKSFMVHSWNAHLFTLLVSEETCSSCYHSMCLPDTETQGLIDLKMGEI